MKLTRLLALLLCLCPLTVYAQTAAVGGAVQDPSGAVIPKASVEFRNQDTGIRRQTATNNAGYYNIANLDPGKYDATIEATGFKALTRENIVLHVGENAQIDFRMEVGQASQSVTVTGSGMQINTTDGSVSTVVDRNFVQNMPLNGRSFQDLLMLTPGVETTSPQTSSQVGSAGEFSVNGQRTESNVYTVDGVNANTGGFFQGYGTPGSSGSLPAATALGTTQSLVSADDLQEFRVNSSSYSAEYGLSPGGQFAFETRSGTNDLHGTLFDYLRNDVLDANNWFNDNTTPITPKPAERQNDFGGTLGGPVRIPTIYDGRNKSFFFASYEGLRLTEPQAAQTTYVPSVALRQSAPDGLDAILNAFPVPTGPALTNGLAPFAEAYSLPGSLDSTSIRLDQKISSKIKVFDRFADTQSTTKSRYIYGLSELSSTNQRNYTNTTGVTSIFSSRIANDFRVNYTSSTGSQSNVLDDFGGATPANFYSLFGLDQTADPYADADFALFFSGYESQLVAAINSQPQHAWDINDSTTASFGRHVLKAGFDYRRISSQFVAPTPDVFLAYTSAADILANTSLLGLVEVSDKNYPAYTNLGLYIQDEVKASRRLNLSLGLRWEVNPPPTSTSGPLPYIVQGNLSDPSSLALADEGTRFWKTSYFNFAPRIGVAYRVHDRAGMETVLRAGGGVFFDSGQQASTQAFGESIGQNATALYFGTSYPFTPAQLNVQIANPPVAPYDADGFYFPSRLQLPYTLQWNVSLEQALGESQSLTLSYVGSNGRRLLYQQDITEDSSVFPDGIIVNGSGTTSSYNALEVKFQRSLSRGLQVLASYNWSHSIDFGSQDYAFAQIRGNSDYDLRNNVNLAATYNVPKSESGRLVSALASHWSLDTRFAARGAYPVTLDGNEITLPDGQSAYQGLNLIPGTPVYLHASGIPGNRQINPAAFSVPASDAYGNAPRNFVRGFGMNQLDFAVHRAFHIRESLNLQFRAEMFNILNHPDFGYIEPLYGNPQFGQATQTLNESLGTLSPLYQQGGPRSVQLMLKAQF